MWDFWKRNRALRKPERVEAWARQAGQSLDLRQVSLALEAGMLGFVLTGYFYNVIFDVPWFYTLLTINTLLFHLTRPGAPGDRRWPGSRHGAGWRTAGISAISPARNTRG